MTREIKFRGKRVDNGEWVYGDLIRHYENQRRFVAYDQLAYTYTVCGINRLVTEHYFEIDPTTVGQYTGLCDKNGVEIYEGDIVDSTSELFTNFGITPTGQFATSLYEILWHKDYWAKKEIQNSRWTKTWSNYGRINGCVALLCEKYFIVIGNIYDNPELLEVEHGK